MPTASQSISQLLQEYASKAGLSVDAAESGTDFTGAPTAKLRLKSPTGAMQTLETSERLCAEMEQNSVLREELASYLRTLAKRMHSPRPDLFLTLHGLPLSM